ncbi:hypothetical protein [Treponema sp.]|uniref:hypothetical protein n=1 Tax=Treponema sp. TaxID=166 RepID=UPI00298DB5EF|nr:hypothetical protein [Treponema sp.]MCQ2241393.1 hypothetical protein [Treponema sp.]
MTKETFIEKFIDILQTEDSITMDSILDDIEEWDSLSTLATVSWFISEGKKEVTTKVLSECVKVSDIAKLMGID